MLKIAPDGLRAYNAPPSKETEITALVNQMSEVMGSWMSSASEIKGRVKALESTKLTEVLKEAFTRLDMAQDNLAWVEQLSTLIDCESFDTAASSVSSDSWISLREQVDLFKQCAKNVPPRPSFSFTVLYEQLKEVSFKLIRMLVDTFGVADFFDIADNRMVAQSRGWRIMFLMQIFDMTVRVLKLVMFNDRAKDEIKAKIENQVNILSGLFIGVNIVLSVIDRFFKPRPWFIPGAINWTQQIRAGAFAATPLRLEVCDQIYQKMRLKSGGSVHTLLIGQTGVGKTEAARTFAKGVYNGRYPELAGKTVFYINCADIVNSSEMFRGGANRAVARIAEAIGDHKDDVILVLDEAHLICQNREGMSLSEELKVQLDPSGAFNKVIAITTKVEYEENIEPDSAFKRRFGSPIYVENMVEDEILTLLNTQVESAGVFVEDGALKQIITTSSRVDKSTESLRPSIEESDGASGEVAAAGVEMEHSATGSQDLEVSVDVCSQPTQPAAALQLLSGCVAHLETAKKSDGQNKLTKVERQMAKMSSEIVASGMLDKSKIEELSGKFDKHIATVKHEKAQFITLQKMRSQLVPIKGKIRELAERVSILTSQELVYFGLLREGLLPMLKARMEQLSKKMKVSVTITKELVGRLGQGDLDVEED